MGVLETVFVARKGPGRSAGTDWRKFPPTTVQRVLPGPSAVRLVLGFKEWIVATKRAVLAPECQETIIPRRWAEMLLIGHLPRCKTLVHMDWDLKTREPAAADT